MPCVSTDVGSPSGPTADTHAFPAHSPVPLAPGCCSCPPPPAHLVLRGSRSRGLSLRAPPPSPLYWHWDPTPPPQRWQESCRALWGLSRCCCPLPHPLLSVTLLSSARPPHASSPPPSQVPPSLPLPLPLKPLGETSRRDPCQVCPPTSTRRPHPTPLTPRGHRAAPRPRHPNHPRRPLFWNIHSSI